MKRPQPNPVAEAAKLITVRHENLRRIRGLGVSDTIPEKEFRFVIQQLEPLTPRQRAIMKRFEAWQLRTYGRLA